MIGKKIYVALGILALGIMLFCGVNAQTTKEIDYSSPLGMQQTTDANLFVSVLKYDPYPVNAGEWFDLWVKVQNIGQNDAPDTMFELSPTYPFSSNDSLARAYGIIPGTINAFKISSDRDASQVILKYRVFVADNSPTGTSNLKFVAKTNGNLSSVVSYDLPIEIAKTKTDFDVKLRDVNPQESSFVITNIGENDAKAVTVDVKMEGMITLSGAEPVSIGTLKQGDFTIAHLQIVPKQDVKSMTLEIAYTDTVGVRSVLQKTVLLNGNALQNVCVKSPENGYMLLGWAAGGFITGAFLMVLIKLLRQKAKKNEK